MFKCEICGKEYKYEKSFAKHMDSHSQSGEEIMVASLNQVLEALQLLNSRMDTIEEKLEEPEKPEEIQQYLPELRANKLQAINDAPKMTVIGSTNDYGEPESVSMCGHKWVLEINKPNELPEPIAARVLQQRKLRERRDEVALHYASRAALGPKSQEEIMEEVRHIL